jgi:hypothetical protein
MGCGMHQSSPPKGLQKPPFILLMTWPQAGQLWVTSLQESMLEKEREREREGQGERQGEGGQERKEGGG